MAITFAAKLRMASAALGCDSRKDFLAHFRRVNPATQCDLERLSKWIQGRSLPRASSVYGDLAAVIGTAKPARWVVECSVEEFAAELAALTGADPAALMLPGTLPRQPNARGGGFFGGLATLAGAFAGYSLSWSPHFRGRVVRGSLHLDVAKNGAMAATYGEALIGREVRLIGEVQISGRWIHFLTREPDGDLPLFFSLHSPGPPASVMCGIMAGAAFVSNETLPSASRIVFVRVPDTPVLTGSNRYFELAPGVVGADLQALGVAADAAEGVDEIARAFLGATLDQVTQQDQAMFASILDRAYLGDLPGRQAGQSREDRPAPAGGD